MRYSDLDAGQAAEVAGEAFSDTIDHPAGTLPTLPAGQQVVGYPADNAAQLDLPGGKHGVVESMEPIAIETSPGHHEPLDLKPTEAGGVFQPTRSGVGVRIPKQLTNGVQLPTSGVSLTPVDKNGSALGGEGVIDGTTVLYANTQTDSDTVVKPLATGFEEDTLLRSVNSPSQLSFQVGMPSGATLVSAKDGSGAAEVLDGGSTVAVIPTPTARDAEGTVVPVSMSLSGDTLVVNIDEHAGQYRYPIVVDPTVTEKGGYEGEILWHQTWSFYTANASIFQAYQLEKGCCGGVQRYLKDVVSKSVAAGERGFFYYVTQGLSRIYAVTAHTNFEGYAGSKMENVLGIFNVHSGQSEVSQAWIENYGSEGTICSEPGCASGSVNESNDKSEVFYQQDERETNEWGGGTSNFWTSAVDIVQEVGPSASLVPSTKWVNPTREYIPISLNASDPGLGISSDVFRAGSWQVEGYSGCNSGVQCTECHSTGCGGSPITVENYGLPEGEDAVEATVKDPVGLSATATTTVKNDEQAPYNLTLTGFPADHEISFGRYIVKVSATDGTGTIKSSGIASIALAIDGREVGTPRGGCSPGPCTGTGEWAINGEEYAAGKHIFTMTATDGAGNVKKEDFPLTIESSESKGVGPGSVDLTSGAYTLNATDVSIASPGEGLSVQRSYNSRHLTEGAEGPLGPQWSGLGMGGSQSLAMLPTGSMLLTAANGQQSVFAKEGTKFVSPTGDASLTLEESEANVFTLAEQNGTVTTFTLPSGGSGTVFTPHTREDPGIAGMVKYTYQTVGGITEPTQALAPVAAGITCTTLVKGCRALTFSYATATTAVGEAESEWGEYAGRLVGISFTAWDPGKSEMTTTAVARYSYDRQGRLRAEWDPRISPALKTTYGYDPEGHVVSLTSAGQETWAFTYTSIASDPNTGRLLKAAEAPASAGLWNGLGLGNTEAPKILGTAMVGNRMGVSTGAWANGPVTYGYQWERCSRSGSECVPITGAVNPNYTPVEADVGHSLAAAVTAINGDDSLTATSAASGPVGANGAPQYISSTPGPPEAYKSPSDVAVSSASGSKGDVWILDAGNDQLVELNESGEFIRRAGSASQGPGQLSSPRSLTVDAKGDVWVADKGNLKVKEFGEQGEYKQEFKVKGTLVGPVGIAVDASGNVWVTTTGPTSIQEFTEKGEYLQTIGTKGSGNGQFTGPSGITINEGHIWVADTGNHRVQELNGKGEFLRAIGTEGEGHGEFLEPEDIAITTKHLWVLDKGDDKLQELEENGEYRGAAGSKGEGNGQFNGPEGMAVDAKGDLWVADTINNRIQRLNKWGEYEKQFDTEGMTKDALSFPLGVGATSLGNIWVADDESSLVELNEKGEFTGSVSSKAGWITGGNHEGDLWVTTGASSIEHFGKHGELLSKFGSEGSGSGQLKYPAGLAVDGKGNIWVSDNGNNRVEEFREDGEYVSQFGSEGTGNGQFESPRGIAVDSKGHIWVVDCGNSRVEEFDENGELLHTFGSRGSGAGQFIAPEGIAIDPQGNFWVVDTGNDRVEEFNEAGEYKTAFGEAGKAPYQFTLPIGIAIDHSDDMWIADRGESRSEPEGHYLEQWKVLSKVEAEAISPAAGSTVVYGVPISGTGSPNAMNSTEVEKWGQKADPSEATAIFPPDEPQTSPASDYRRATVYYLDNHGRTVNVASPGGAISMSEYNSTDDVVRALSPDNRAAALKEGSKSAEASKLLDTESTYNSEGTELQGTLGPQHRVKLASGSTVEARDHQQYYYEEGAPSEGGPYRLVTKVTGGAQYSGKEEEVRTTTTSYSGQSNLGWKLRRPTSVTTDPNGLKLTHTTLYEAGTGNVTETRMPASPGENSAHDSQTIYYTAGANSKYPVCGEHPEWAELPCQTLPAKQPETSGVFNLPVTTVTYNIWDEPEKITEAVGSTTRTKTATYDAAGRLKTSAISSTVGTAVPTVTEEYSPETGALVKQCANEGKACTEGKPKTITSAYNTIGELTSYTDADENTSTYNYDIDGRVEKDSDGKGTQTYTYDPTTGFPTKLVDSAAGTFTGSYDIEGKILTEGYPNGMNANYTYNQDGTATGLEYVKTTHCTQKCVWFSDGLIPSIHGQSLEQTSMLSHQAYTYDAAGRLTQVQNTPAGKGCATRIYGYDSDTNRLSLTTREPGSKGECTTTGGTVESHSYDTADRLLDTGTAYSTFGNITSLPAADAGGSSLTSAFYTDNQLQSETQNGETIGYNLDPDGRTRETVSTGKTNSTVTNHYAGPGSSPAWTVNTTGESTRSIAGLTGFAAVQKNAEAPVLQLADLHGDIIATAPLSETATALASTTDTSEFGVPTTTTPPKYSWLGGDEIPTELPSGVLDMGARSYVPQLGRFLQPDPQSGGSANAYTYTFGDPVNSSDPSGEYTVGGPSQALIGYTQQIASEAAADQAAINAAARAEAERKAREAEEIAAAAAGPQYEGEAGPLGGSAGWACEDAGVTGQEVEGCGGGSGGGDECSGDNACAAAPCADGDNPRSGHCGAGGSCGCDVWIHGGKIAIGNSDRIFLGAAEVTAGTVGAAASGFAFGACVLGGGEFDVAIHCVLGPGVAFTASVSVVVAGLKELFH